MCIRDSVVISEKGVDANNSDTKVSDGKVTTKKTIFSIFEQMMKEKNVKKDNFVDERKLDEIKGDLPATPHLDYRVSRHVHFTPVNASSIINDDVVEEQFFTPAVGKTPTGMSVKSHQKDILSAKKPIFPKISGETADNFIESMMSRLNVGGESVHTPSRSVNRELNRVSCLLYTSPSPRDRQKSRMPSSA